MRREWFCSWRLRGARPSRSLWLPQSRQDSYSLNDKRYKMLKVWYMHVFMCTWSNFEFSTQTQAKIRQQLSARHVPALILPISDIPYTVNGKKVTKWQNIITWISYLALQKNNDHMMHLLKYSANRWRLGCINTSCSQRNPECGITQPRVQILAEYRALGCSLGLVDIKTKVEF